MQEILSKIEVTDNFFPIVLQKEMINTFLAYDVQWSYQPFISYHKHRDKEIIKKWTENNTVLDTDAFVLTIKDDKEEHPYFETLSKNIKFFAQQKFQISIKEFLRINLVFLPPNPSYKPGYHLFPHVDRNIPHKNLLYYLNDNDADTLFYDKIYNINSSYDYSKYNIVKRVTPKQGRAVLFDGLIFHSGNVSSIDKRLTLNINFI